MENSSELFSLARELIEIESITGNELKMAEYLKSYLEPKGWIVHLQDVEDGRKNVFAHRKGNPKPKLIVNSHIDTVPPYIPFSEDEKYIYGRGACDTKALIAAQLMSVNSLVENGIDQIGLLYVVGEEVDHCGIIKANELNLNPEFLVVAEPTELQLASRQKGMDRFRLKAKGKAAHSGYPEAGESAIHKLIPVLKEIIDTTWPSSKDVGVTTVNIGTVQGGFAGNVLAADCEAEVVFRVADELELVEKKVEEIVSNSADIEVLVKSPPVSLGVHAGMKSTVVSFHTDIPHFKFEGQAFLVGAGSILDAHTAHEKVDKDELVEMVSVYDKLISDLLGAS